MRTPVVGGNWKMHTSRAEASALLHGLRAELDREPGVEVVVFPPAPWLGDAADALGSSTLEVGAQHVYWQPSGAFTGEVSASMLRGTVTRVLVGHSERRHVFGQTDEDVRLTLQAVLDAGLAPVLAVGETEVERDAGRTLEVLRRQLEAAFEGLAAYPPALVVAYEPVWAIGTGRTPTVDAAQEACAAVRAVVGQRFGTGAFDAVLVQYGGSVTADNVADFAACPDIDGALVGGASLRVDSFAAICRAVAAAAEAKQAAAAG